jgi:hypothetical protein
MEKELSESGWSFVEDDNVLVLEEYKDQMVTIKTYFNYDEQDPLTHPYERTMFGKDWIYDSDLTGKMGATIFSVTLRKGPVFIKPGRYYSLGHMRELDSDLLAYLTRSQITQPTEART